MLWLPIIQIDYLGFVSWVATAYLTVLAPTGLLDP